MGWYANTTWHITITTNITDLAADLRAQATKLDTETGALSENHPLPALSATWADMDDTAVVVDALAQFNEDGDFDIDTTGDAITIQGWGGGKAYSPGLPPDIHTIDTPSGPQHSNRGGMDLYTILARHCTGSVDWDDQDDGSQWRIRFADGQATAHTATTIYPTDIVDGIGALYVDRVDIDLLQTQYEALQRITTGTELPDDRGLLTGIVEALGDALTTAGRPGA